MHAVKLGQLTAWTVITLVASDGLALLAPPVLLRSVV